MLKKGVNMSHFLSFFHIYDAEDMKTQSVFLRIIIETKPNFWEQDSMLYDIEHIVDFRKQK